MVVDKEKLKKKLLNKINHCDICKKLVTYTEIKNGDFEYVKGKITSAKIYHKKCLINELQRIHNESATIINERM